MQFAGMSCQFIGKISTNDVLPWVLVLGIEWKFDELQFFVQILVVKLQPIEESGIDDVQFGQHDVKLLEVDRSFALRQLSEATHDQLFGDLLIENVVGFGVDQHLADGHRVRLFAEPVEGLVAA
jgi:hypothetical protein